VGEVVIHDTIVWVENALVKSGKFSLLGKKVFYGGDTEFEVVLVDVMESPVECSKKCKNVAMVEKRVGIS